MPNSSAIASLIAAFASLAATPAYAAGACDYAPSKLVGNTSSTAAGAGAAATAATGMGMKAVGLYAIQNAVTGAWMLGSTRRGLRLPELRASWPGRPV